MSDAGNLRIISLSDRWLSRPGRMFMPVWITLLVLAIGWGWSIREQNYLDAESGLGYWLGIAGGSMMLLLLSYSLRKRLKVLRKVFNIKAWFQLHMTLGILGPLLILFHSNFQLGSLNSNVALICMLLVAGSGFIGRYLYSQIHYNLYGEKIKLQQVRKDLQSMQAEFLTLAITDKQEQAINNLFDQISELADTHSRSTRTWSTRKSRRLANRLIATLQKLAELLNRKNKQSADRDSSLDSMRKQIDLNTQLLMTALKKLPGLQRSEYLFSLWHVIHIPVFGLMVLTAINHIVAVHMY